MKKIFLSTGFLFATLFAMAQDTWKIKLNNKTLLSTGTEDESANHRSIAVAEWAKKGNLEVCYKETPAKKEWSRSIFFVDENDNELIRKDNVTHAKVSIEALKKAFAGKSKIRIFTTSTPTDPDLAARVRIRRVHLYTLDL